MLRNLGAAVFVPVALVIAGCASTGGSGTSTLPRHVPIPENPTNPIVYKFEGASFDSVITVVSHGLSSQGIPTFRVDLEKGLLETQWLDMAAWDPTGGARAYPAQERRVMLQFQAGQGVDEAGKKLGMGLVLWAWYQPNAGMARARPQTYRVKVPTQHPGYEFALRVATMIENDMKLAGIKLTPVENVQ